MTINFKLSFLAFTLTFTFINNFAHASIDCPWLKLKGQDLLHFIYSDNTNRDLSAVQVQEDLACLKILFENKYVAQDSHPEINLVGRLNKLSQSATPMKSSQLLDLIYNLHQGIPDLHLGYQVNGIYKRHSGEAKKDVSISENLDTEKIYDRGTFVYFKPAEILMPQLTDSQKSFIELVKKNDRDLVIDLRDARGGGGPFAEDLAQNIFTASQKIPQSKKLQVISGLSYIGLAVTTRIIYKDQVKDFYEAVEIMVKDKNISDLVSFKIQETSTNRIGQRTTPYKSKIILLIDGTCASECETIVELLSKHPNVSLIGQNTAGALHFSNAISFTLPHSGIWVRIPSLTQVLENDAVEGVGYPPSIETDYIDLNKLVF